MSQPLYNISFTFINQEQIWFWNLKTELDPEVFKAIRQLPKPEDSNEDKDTTTVAPKEATSPAEGSGLNGFNIEEKGIVENFYPRPVDSEGIVYLWLCSNQ